MFFCPRLGLFFGIFVLLKTPSPFPHNPFNQCDVISVYFSPPRIVTTLFGTLASPSMFQLLQPSIIFINFELLHHFHIFEYYFWCNFYSICALLYVLLFRVIH